MEFSLQSVPCPTYLFLACMRSAVPSFTSLFLVSRPLSSVSLLCSLSPVFCTLSHVICSLSPTLLSPSYNPYQQSQCLLFSFLLPLFLSFSLLFPVLCSSVSCPLFLVFHIARMRAFLKNRHALHLEIGDFDDWLTAGTVLVH
jgi:hypothetical protein